MVGLLATLSISVLGELGLRAIFWSDLPAWKDIAFELIKLTPTAFLGIIAVYIAFRQYATAKTKIKLDLFDKRYKIYEAFIPLVNTLHRIDCGGDVFFQQIYQRYLGDSRGKEFLLPRKIVSQMKYCESVAREYSDF